MYCYLSVGNILMILAIAICYCAATSICRWYIEIKTYCYLVSVNGPTTII